MMGIWHPCHLCSNMSIAVEYQQKARGMPNLYHMTDTIIQGLYQFVFEPEKVLLDPRNMDK